MSAPNRKSASGQYTEAILIFSALGVLAVVVGGIWISAHAGSSLAGLPAPPTNPVLLVSGLVKGEVAWSGESTMVAVALVGLLVALVITIAVLVVKRSSNRVRVDKAARYMGRGKSLASFTERGAKKTAERLGVTASPGIEVGSVVATGQTFYQPWEDLSLDIWGPRTGKSTSRIIPAILDAPGAVISTSNKRDVVDATRGVRAECAPVWVFDPQKIAQEEPSWWWNPLSYVTDEDKAAKLTQHFAVASRAPGSKADAYFDPKAEDLLASMFLAAALDRRPITDVYIWITTQVSKDPVHILTEHDYPLQAAGLEATIDLTEKQRDGVFGTAEKMVQCLKTRNTLRWVAPSAGATVATERRVEFDPRRFAESRETLYVLSKEGVGTAAPLTTALTVAVAEAMEERAERLGGRLDVPALLALDELANVVRWAGLPDQFSHYGSRGIIVMGILQSWSQGVELWNESNMRKIWSAANIKVYGGGVAEDGFLRALSDLIGDYSYTSVSSSNGKSGHSRSRQQTKERIFDVSNLAELERGRAVVFASGAPATLIKTHPWYKGKHKVAVEASIAQHSPSGESEPAKNPWITATQDGAPR